MKSKKVVSYAALAGLVSFGMGIASVQAATPAWATKGETIEKCLGVSAKGKNDCGAKNGSHACSGKATTDRSPDEWVYTPTGLCEKLGGTVWKTKTVS